jgi:hypothetical protein
MLHMLGFLIYYPVAHKQVTGFIEHLVHHTFGTRQNLKGKKQNLECGQRLQNEKLFVQDKKNLFLRIYVWLRKTLIYLDCGDSIHTSDKKDVFFHKKIKNWKKVCFFC